MLSRNLRILMMIILVIIIVIPLLALYIINTLLESEPEQKQQYSFVRAWGSEGSENGVFIASNGVAVDSSSNVYVADTGNDPIQVFAPLSNLLPKYATAFTPPLLLITSNYK